MDSLGVMALLYLILREVLTLGELCGLGNLANPLLLGVVESL
jgi:hypothetical protein